MASSISGTPVGSTDTFTSDWGEWGKQPPTQRRSKSASVKQSVSQTLTPTSTDLTTSPREKKSPAPVVGSGSPGGVEGKGEGGGDGGGGGGGGGGGRTPLDTSTPTRPQAVQGKSQVSLGKHFQSSAQNSFCQYLRYLCNTTR